MVSFIASSFLLSERKDVTHHYSFPFSWLAQINPMLKQVRLDYAVGLDVYKVPAVITTDVAAASTGTSSLETTTVGTGLSGDRGFMTDCLETRVTVMRQHPG